MSTTHFPVLLADIGGTNARFALQFKTQGAPQEIKTLACADYPDIVAAINAYLATQTTARPQTAVIAIANPITGDYVQMTNHHWHFSIEAVRQQLGFAHFQLLNDFTALALSLPHLAANEQVQIGTGTALARRPIALIGPGTGLGVSGLIPSGATNWTPLAGEGGHVSVTPETAEEERVIHHLRQHIPRISNERVLSGPGLASLYRALCELAGDTPSEFTPTQISQYAQQTPETHPHCQQALTMFCAMLGSAAGDLALTIGAQGGVYIGGGIVPNMLNFFQRSAFRERFSAKGRMHHYLKNIPTFVITAPFPALLGTAAFLA